MTDETNDSIYNYLLPDISLTQLEFANYILIKINNLIATTRKSDLLDAFFENLRKLTIFKKSKSDYL